MMFSYRQALEAVIGKLQAIARTPATESIPLSEAVFRVLARDILSDRDYPPFDRSIRDGYAVRSADTRPGASLRCIGELKAGDSPSIAVTPGACMQIMTGAALPEGADAVIMIEHTSRERDTVHLDRAVKPGQHVVRRGSEQAAGQTVLSAGTRIGFAEIAAAAQVGAASPVVTRKPRIAILSTGDEVVDFALSPGPFQIRNSNSPMLVAAAKSAGTARRRPGRTRGRPAPPDRGARRCAGRSYWWRTSCAWQCQRFARRPARENHRWSRGRRPDSFRRRFDGEVRSCRTGAQRVCRRSYF